MSIENYGEMIEFIENEGENSRIWREWSSKYPELYENFRTLIENDRNARELNVKSGE
jgi:hypothetical protein